MLKIQHPGGRFESLKFGFESRFQKVFSTVKKWNLAYGFESLRDGFESLVFEVFISQIKPKNFKEAELEESWINAMQEELGQSTIQSLVQNG